MPPGHLEKILTVGPRWIMGSWFCNLIKKCFYRLSGSVGKAGWLPVRTGGVDMSEVAMLEGAEPRTILEELMDRRIPAIMSYLSSGKWHVAKVELAGLGAGTVTVRLLAGSKPHPMNIKPDQPVGVSLKFGYGKFIFDSRVLSLEPSADAIRGGTIILELPDRIEMVQRRAFFRVEVPQSLKVNVLLWRRRQQDGAGVGDPQQSQVPPGRYWNGRLVDISAGGAQVAIDSTDGRDFRVGQFVGLRFTPMPYETPLMFNAQIRNILPTADGRSLCLGMQIVGLEASPEGREVLSRLVGVVERYYQMGRSAVKQQDFQGAPTAT